VSPPFLHIIWHYIHPQPSFEPYTAFPPTVLQSRDILSTDRGYWTSDLGDVCQLVFSFSGTDTGNPFLRVDFTKFDSEERAESSLAVSIPDEVLHILLQAPSFFHSIPINNDHMKYIGPHPRFQEASGDELTLPALQIRQRICPFDEKTRGYVVGITCVGEGASVVYL